MSALQRNVSEFEALDAQVVGISTDSPYSHMGWQQHQVGELTFPLLSDFYPHGKVAQLYDPLRTETMPLAGINERVIYVVAKGGEIIFAKHYSLGENPDVTEVLEVVRKLHDSRVPLAAGRG